MPSLLFLVHTRICICASAHDRLAREIAGPGEFKMWDVGCVIAGVAFFLIAIAYTQGCERLATKAGK